MCFVMNIIDWKQEKIKGILSTFDRIIIKGYSLQLSNINQMGYFLSHNNVLLKDFGEYAEKVTKSLCEHIENIAKINNRPYQFLYGNDIDNVSVIITKLRIYLYLVNKFGIRFCSNIDQILNTNFYYRKTNDTIK